MKKTPRHSIKKCPDCGFHYAMPSGKRRCEPCQARAEKATRSSPSAIKKNAARLLTQQAVAEGKLTRQPCEVCGSERVHAHHINYDDPLNVRWLCAHHHMKQHAFLRWRASLSTHSRSEAEVERIVDRCLGWAEERDFAKRWGALTTTSETEDR